MSTTPRDDFIIKGNAIYKYRGNDEVVVVPNDIKEIWSFAFKDKTKIKKIVLPVGLEEIGCSAFERCTGLTKVEIPHTVAKIGKRAFARCYNLEEINMGESLEVIEDLAFSFCSKLRRLVLPRNLTTFLPTAVNNCSSLTEIFVNMRNQNFVSDNGILYTSCFSKLVRCPEGLSATNLEVPKQVVAIGKYAFANCTKILNMTMPEHLLSVGSFAFMNMTKLETLSINSDMDNFEVDSMKGWSSKQKIIIGDKIPIHIKENIYLKLIELSEKQKINSDKQYGLVKTMFESYEEAEQIVKQLLDLHLIASGQIRKDVTSIYLWNGSICKEEEYELICITEFDRWKEVEKYLVENHSYDVCECAFIPYLDTSEPYGRWIKECLE